VDTTISRLKKFINFTPSATMIMYIKNYKFSIQELGILPSDIELLLGFTPGSAPDPFPGMIRNILAEISDITNISGGYKKFNDISIDKNKNTISINGQVFHPGKYAAEQFTNAVSAVIFVCTAGKEISDLSALKRDKGNQLDDYITGITGSVIVEKSAEKLRTIIETEAGKENLYITSSFSPGYCEWDVAEQQKLFKLLPDEFCGIKLSPSSLMDPVKSLSGIICSGPDFFEPEKPCFRCSDRHCIFGKMRRLKKS